MTDIMEFAGAGAALFAAGMLAPVWVFFVVLAIVMGLSLAKSARDMLS